MEFSSIGEMLAVPHMQALEFFASGLKDVSKGPVRKIELLYSASVLAHYAQVSCDADGEGEDVPCPRTLDDVFDFELGRVSNGDIVIPYNIHEVKACQTLLFCGFFHRQMRQRHNLNWYERIGSTYFKQASLRLPEGRKADLLASMSSGFPFWAERFRDLEQELRDKPYLLRMETTTGVQ